MTDLFLYVQTEYDNMALTLEGLANSMSGSSPSSPFTVACQSGGDRRVLIVGLSFVGATAAITDVTYNGVSMTLFESQSLGGTTANSYGYYLVNPDSGSNTISVSWSGSMTQIHITGISFSDAAQSAPNVDSGSTGNLVSTISTTVSPTAIKGWVVDFASHNQGINVGSGQTLFYTLNDGTFINASSSYKKMQTGGDQTMKWTGTNLQIAHVVAVVQQYGGDELHVNRLRPSIFMPGLAK